MNRKIMIVDDSNMSRRALRRILEEAGHNVVEADGGMLALEMYFLEKPDMVFLDLVMKDMYGLDVLARLREMDDEARVIVASADIQKSTHDLIAEGGARGFINKPFNVAQVVEAVNVALSERQA